MHFVLDDMFGIEQKWCVHRKCVCVFLLMKLLH